MRNKILALAFFACSFAAISQAAVAAPCTCGNPPDPSTQQLSCVEAQGEYFTLPGGKGVTLGPGACFYNCHCNLGNVCKGGDAFQGQPGRCLPGVALQKVN